MSTEILDTGRCEILDTGRCYGYIRVSTDRQARSGSSLSEQTDSITRYATDKSLQQPKIFSDTESAYRFPIAKRESGGVLVDTLRSGDHLIITRVDRAFRTFPDFVKWFEHWLSAGVHLHVIDFGGNTIDPRTSIGRLVFRVLAATTALATELHGERISAVYQYRRSQGMYASPRCVGLGFKAVKVSSGGYRAVPDPVERKLMAEMLRWYEDHGMTIDQIRQHLNRSNAPNRGHVNGSRDWSHVAIKKRINTERELRLAEQGAAIEQGALPDVRLTRTSGNQPSSRSIP